MTRTALALPLLLTPGLAFADITPEDVWANMQASYAAMGLEVSGTATRSGETLTITDGAVTLTYPVIGGQMVATLPQMGLIAQGDGTVRVLTPDTYVISVTGDVPEEEAQFAIDVAISQNGSGTIASGDPGDITYVTDSGALQVLVTSTEMAGEDASFTLEYKSDGSATSTRVTEGDPLMIVGNSVETGASTRFVMNGGGMSQESVTEGGSAAVEFSMALPSDMNILNLTPALASGLALSATVATGPSSSRTTTTVDGMAPSEQVQNMGNGSATMSLDASGLSLDASYAEFDAVITQPDMIPFPIAFSGTGAGGRFAIPMIASEEPQGFVYALNINGLEIDDMIWGMVDPGATLDRSPIDLALDLQGDLQWNLDTLDFAAYETLGMSGEMPVLPLSARIETLALTALGASVTGTGAFTFDPTDMATFPGVPRPEGSAKLSATGLNGAIDQLVAAGLLPEDQAGMGRMFMGMFSQSTGEDSLETEVVITGDGGVILNGQPIR